jgi:hypothetical protein
VRTGEVPLELWRAVSRGSAASLAVFRALRPPSAPPSRHQRGLPIRALRPVFGGSPRGATCGSSAACSVLVRLRSWRRSPSPGGASLKWACGPLRGLKPRRPLGWRARGCFVGGWPLATIHAVSWGKAPTGSRLRASIRGRVPSSRGVHVAAQRGPRASLCPRRTAPWGTWWGQMDGLGGFNGRITALGTPRSGAASAAPSL